MRLLKPLFLIAVPLAMLYPMQAIPTQSTPTLVWVRCNGDDGLTQRLCDALKRAFKSASDFQLSSGQKPGTLIVAVPTNVGWKRVGRRTRALYTIDFTLGGKNLGSSKGSCWDGELEKCAAEILKHAKIRA